MRRKTEKERFEKLLGRPTPFYAWDLELFQERISYVFSCFSRFPKFRLFYSMKSNPSPLDIRAILGTDAGVDVCSVGELNLALSQGIPPTIISACPFVPNREELSRYLDSGCDLALDSIQDISLVSEILPKGKKIGLRVNPDVRAGFHDHCASGVWNSKFGIPLEELPQALELANSHGIQIAGLHVHAGSSAYDPKPYLEAISKLLRYVKLLGLESGYVNIGGGWGIPFDTQEDSDSQDHFPLDQYAGAIAALLEEQGLLETLEVRAEPGEFLIGPCGFLVCQVRRVLDRRNEEKELRIAVIDGGSYLYPGPSLYGAENFILILNRNEPKNKEQLIAGRSMLAGDLFGPMRVLPVMKEGDTLAIGSAGAYSYAKRSGFNLLPLLGEFIL